MGEVAVAFPFDETSGEVLASRLRAEGIRARVDRGLYGVWLTAQPGQITVLVDEKDAARAKEILRKKTRPRKRVR
jgi:type III secretory pathway lipoprotein EscJ